MAFSARAATKDAARFRRRRAWPPPRFSSTLPADLRDRHDGCAVARRRNRTRNWRVFIQAKPSLPLNERSFRTSPSDRCFYLTGGVQIRCQENRVLSMPHHAGFSTYSWPSRLSNLPASQVTRVGTQGGATAKGDLFSIDWTTVAATRTTGAACRRKSTS